MNLIERINALSPYKVSLKENGSLCFSTSSGSVYEVGFVEDYTFMNENAYQFFIIELEGNHSVKDELVKQTIWVIIETFFSEMILLCCISAICLMGNKLLETDYFPFGITNMKTKKILLTCQPK